jgi:hypothetical protein
MKESGPSASTSLQDVRHVRARPGSCASAPRGGRERERLASAGEGAANSLWHFLQTSSKNCGFKPAEAQKSLWQTATPSKSRREKVPQPGSCTLPEMPPGIELNESATYDYIASSFILSGLCCQGPDFSDHRRNSDAFSFQNDDQLRCELTGGVQHVSHRGGKLTWLCWLLQQVDLSLY